MKIWESGGIPFGFIFDRITGNIRVDPKEREILEEIINSYFDGLGVNLITQKLNEKRIPTRRKVKWSTPTIATILSPKRLKFYRKIDFESDICKNYQPLLSKEDYDKLIAQRESTKLIEPRGPKKRYLLSGLGIFKCGYCGGSVKSSVTKKNEQAILYYICSNRQTSGRTSCGESKLHPQENINNLIEFALVKKIEPQMSFLISKYINGLKEETNYKLKQKFTEMVEKFYKRIDTDMGEAIAIILESSKELIEYWDIFSRVIKPVEFSREKLQEGIKKNINEIKLFNDKLELIYKFPIDRELKLEETIPIF